MARLPTVDELLSAAAQSEQPAPSPFSLSQAFGSIGEPGGIMPVPASGPMVTKEGVNEAVSAARPLALPLTGAALGMMTGPAAPIAVPFLSALGEVGNQALGITEPSLTDILMQFGFGVTPGALATPASETISAGLRRLPGATPVMHELAEEQLRRMVTQFSPQRSAEELYAFVSQFEPKVQLPRLNSVTAELLTKEQIAEAGLKLPTVGETSRSFQKTLAPTIEPAKTEPSLLVDVQGRSYPPRVISPKRVISPGGEMAFQDVRVNLRRIGDKIRETRELGGEEHGAWKKIFKAIMDDLDAAVAGGNSAKPAVQALKEANKAARREFAAAEIADIASIKGGGITIRADLGTMASGEPQVQVNLNKIIKDIKKNDDIRKTLSPKEYRDMIDDLTEIAERLRALPPMAGANVGSYRALRSMGLGAGAGSTVGLGLQKLGLADATTAAMLGTMGLAAGAYGPQVLSKIVLTAGGRELLRKSLLDGGGLLSAKTLAFLGSTVGATETGRDIGKGLTQIGSGGME